MTNEQCEYYAMCVCVFFVSSETEIVNTMSIISKQVYRSTVFE